MRQLTSGFNLGGQQAEADPLLSEAFFESAVIRAIESRTDQTTFLIGRTGSGKSAALSYLEQAHADHVIRLNPEDLSLPYVSDSQIVRYLTAEKVHLDPLFIALWKHVLVVEVLRHRYKIDTPEAKQNFFTMLLDRLRGDRRKSEALKYLNDFQDKFWCTADLRIREITDEFEASVKRVGGVNIPTGLSTGTANLSGEAGHSEKTTAREEWVGKIQRLVNETQLPRLNQMIKVLDEDILNTPTHFTYVVIDDLDRDWVDDSVANDLIRCLFRAVLDLKRVSNLKVLVALRTNIFEALDFGNKTGGQEEKFRALSAHLRWSRRDLETMLSERVRAASAKWGADLSDIKSLMPSTNRARGNALDYVLDRTLQRPRDAIAFLNGALIEATGNPRITWDQLHGAETAYSIGRLLALRDEWKPTYPCIDQIFHAFRGSSPTLFPEDLERVLQEVALLSVSDHVPLTEWLGPLCEDVWTDHQGTLSDQFGSLIRLLFAIGFLGCLGRAGGKPVYSYTIADYLSNDSVIDDCPKFVVHPAFRSALDIRHGQHEPTG